MDAIGRSRGGARRARLGHAARAAVALLLLSPAPSRGSSHLQFSGSNTFSGQTATRRGTGQELPADFWRNDLSFFVGAYGVPIWVRGTFSSLQSVDRQDVNRFTVSLDLRSLARRRLVGGLGFLRRFRAVEVGACRPRYSPLVLDGLPVTGANLEFQTSCLYFACAAGRGHKAIPRAGALGSTYDQDVLFGALGYGPRERTHVHLSLLHVREDAGDADGYVSLEAPPRESFALGLSGRLVLWQGRWVTDAEVASSMLTRDLNAPELDAGEWDLPAWLADILQPRISSSADYAWILRSAFQTHSTQLTGGVRSIGPGYASLGAPNLRGDQLAYDASLRQGFWGGRVQGDLFLRRQRDNRVEWKRATTTSRGYGVGATLRPRGGSYARLQYMPSYQEMSDDSAAVENSAHVLSALVGNERPAGSGRLSSQINYSLHLGKTSTAAPDARRTRSHAVNVSEAFSYPSGLGLRLSAGLRSTDLGGGTQNLWSAGLGGSHAPTVWLRVGLGADWMRERDGRRWGVDGRLNLRLGRWGDLDVAGEQRFYRESGKVTATVAEPAGAGDYDEFVLRGSLTTRW